MRTLFSSARFWMVALVIILLLFFGFKTGEWKDIGIFCAVMLVPVILIFKWGKGSSGQ